MQKTSNLAAQLKKQIKQEHETFQDLTQEQLDTLRIKLTDIYREELDIIKNDIQSLNGNLLWSLIKTRLLWPFIIGLSLCLGLFAGSWAMMRYYSHQIIELQKNVATLEQQGGKIQFERCGQDRQLCVKVQTDLGTFGENYMVLEGY